MARIVKRKISWDASTADDVEKYRVYWEEAPTVPTYASPHVETTETFIVIPDDAPSFPTKEGDYVIGVSAVDKVGNESDINTVTAPFDFTAPDAPGNVTVESIFG